MNDDEGTRMSDLINYERPEGNVYRLPDTPENWELLETIEDNRQHPERGKSCPVRNA